MQVASLLGEFRFVTGNRCNIKYQYLKLNAYFNLIFIGSCIIVIVENKRPTCRLEPATRIPLQPNHTETPTHIQPRKIRPMW